MRQKEIYPFSLHRWALLWDARKARGKTKPTQNKPKPNTLLPQILPVCKNNLQTKIMGFTSQWTGSADFFFPVKSVFDRIPSLLFFCLRKLNKNKKRGSQIVSVKVDRIKDNIWIGLIVHQLCFANILLLTLIFKAWLILVSAGFLHHLH